jgi:hypothetical protein
VRRFEFPVDRAHAKAVNETIADLRRVAVTSIVLALVLGGGAVWLMSVMRAWAYILAVVLAMGAATALWVAIWAPRRLGGIERLYTEGALVPAVVTGTPKRGLILLALIDIGKPGTTPQYALVTRKVKTLPGHKTEPGERVPSVSVRSDRSPRPAADSLQQVIPMPIAWATTDADVIARAAAEIDESEWKLLSDNLALADRVRRATNKRVILDPKTLPRSLR